MKPHAYIEDSLYKKLFEEHDNEHENERSEVYHTDPGGDYS